MRGLAEEVGSLIPRGQVSATEDMTHPGRPWARRVVGAGVMIRANLGGDGLVQRLVDMHAAMSTQCQVPLPAPPSVEAPQPQGAAPLADCRELCWKQHYNSDYDQRPAGSAVQWQAPQPVHDPWDEHQGPPYNACHLHHNPSPNAAPHDHGEDSPGLAGPAQGARSRPGGRRGWVPGGARTTLRHWLRCGCRPGPLRATLCHPLAQGQHSPEAP